MTRDMENDRYDLNRILIKPLYFGLVSNILIPMAGLLVCYYIHNNYGRGNTIGDFDNMLFFIFAILALLQAGFALWWRAKRLQPPMVRSMETFENDLATGLLHSIRPVFIVIAAISIYGYLYFFLTGRFTETVAFIFFSFVVFQIVRPRHGFARKVIARQKEILKQQQS